MQERSEEQIIGRLFELENGGQSERRTELSGERFLSLIQDPDSGRTYVFSHGMDSTEGAEVPEGTEFWEYQTHDEAARAYDQLLAESGLAGEVVEEDAEDGGERRLRVDDRTGHPLNDAEVTTPVCLVRVASC